jgi:hypothetical protein
MSHLHARPVTTDVDNKEAAMDTRECGKSPNGPAWDGRRWTRQLGRMILFIGLVIIAGGPTIAESQDRALHDAGRMPERPGKECKKLQNCPTTVRQIGRLDSIIADDILEQVKPSRLRWNITRQFCFKARRCRGWRKRTRRN